MVPTGKQNVLLWLHDGVFTLYSYCLFVKFSLSHIFVCNQITTSTLSPAAQPMVRGYGFHYDLSGAWSSPLLFEYEHFPNYEINPKSLIALHRQIVFSASKKVIEWTLLWCSLVLALACVAPAQFLILLKRIITRDPLMNAGSSIASCAWIYTASKMFMSSLQFSFFGWLSSKMLIVNTWKIMLLGRTYVELKWAWSRFYFSWQVMVEVCWFNSLIQVINIFIIWDN